MRRGARARGSSTRGSRGRSDGAAAEQRRLPARASVQQPSEDVVRERAAEHAVVEWPRRASLDDADVEVETARPSRTSLLVNVAGEGRASPLVAAEGAPPPSLRDRLQRQSSRPMTPRARPGSSARAGTGRSDTASLFARIENGDAEAAAEVDVNLRDHGGWTPLHRAAISGQAELVGVLLERGADPQARNNVGLTPRDVASGDEARAAIAKAAAEQRQRARENSPRGARAAGAARRQRTGTGDTRPLTKKKSAGDRSLRAIDSAKAVGTSSARSGEQTSSLRKARSRYGSASSVSSARQSLATDSASKDGDGDSVSSQTSPLPLVDGGTFESGVEPIAAKRPQARRPSQGSLGGRGSEPASQALLRGPSLPDMPKIRALQKHNDPEEDRLSRMILSASKLGDMKKIHELLRQHKDFVIGRVQESLDEDAAARRTPPPPPSRSAPRGTDSETAGTDRSSTPTPFPHEADLIRGDSMDDEHTRVAHHAEGARTPSPEPSSSTARAARHARGTPPLPSLRIGDPSDGTTPPMHSAPAGDSRSKGFRSHPRRAVSLDDNTPGLAVPVRIARAGSDTASVCSADTSFSRLSQDTSLFEDGDELLEQFITAAKKGDLEKVIVCLDDEIDINGQDRMGNTALHRAAYWERLDVARLLIERGADLSVANRRGQRPVDVARTEQMRQVIEGDRYQSPQLRRQQSARDAIQKERSMRLMRKSGEGELNSRSTASMYSYVREVNDDGERLVEAAKRGRIREVRVLVDERDVHVDARDKFGWTALHRAVFWDRKDVIHFLVERGADTSLKNNKGKTAIDLAPSEEVRKILLGSRYKSRTERRREAKKKIAMERKISLINASEDGLANSRAERADFQVSTQAEHTRDPSVRFVHACKRGDHETVRRMIAEGVDIDARDELGWTGLHRAVFWDRKEIVAALVHAGADVSLTNPKGKTVLDLAPSEEMRRILQGESYVSARERELGRAKVSEQVVNPRLDLVRLGLGPGGAGGRNAPGALDALLSPRGGARESAGRRVSRRLSLRGDTSTAPTAATANAAKDIFNRKMELAKYIEEEGGGLGEYDEDLGLDAIRLDSDDDDGADGDGDGRRRGDAHRGGSAGRDDGDPEDRGAARRTFIRDLLRKFKQAATQHLTTEEKYKWAAMYVRDAMYGRDAKTDNFGKRQLQVYRFLTHPYYYFAYLVVVLLHISMVFLEPVSSSEVHKLGDNVSVWLTSWKVAYAISWACLAVYTADVGLSLYESGRNAFFAKSTKLWKFVIVLSMIVDAIVYAAAGYVQVTRVLRAFLLVLHIKQTRRSLNTLLHVTPKLGEAILVLSTFVVLYAVIGVSIFASDGGSRYDRSTPSNAVEFFMFEFNNFQNAFFALYVLLTGSNYPNVMYPSYHENRVVGVVYFVSFHILGLYVFLNLVIPLVYKAYKQSRKASILQEAAKERRALAAAFAVLDEVNPDHHGELFFDECAALFRQLRRGMDEKQARKMFESLDVDESNTVDIIEFFAIIDALKLQIDRDEIVQEPWSLLMTASSLMQRGHHFRSEYVRMRAKLTSMVFSTWFMYTMLAAVVAHTTVLALYGTVSTSEESHLVIADGAFVGVFTLEVVLKIIALGWKPYMSIGWNRFDLFVTLASLGNLLLREGLDNDGWVALLLGAIKVMRLFRIFQATEQLDNFFTTILDLFPAISSMVVILFFLVYTYAVAGMEFFYDRYYNANDPQDINFNSFGNAFLILLQLTFQSNWDLVVTAARDTLGGFSSLYFFSYHFVSVFLIINIIVALILDNFEFQQYLQQAARRASVHVSPAGDTSSGSPTKGSSGASTYEQRYTFDTTEGSESARSSNGSESLFPGLVPNDSARLATRSGSMTSVLTTSNVREVATDNSEQMDAMLRPTPAELARVSDKNKSMFFASPHGKRREELTRDVFAGLEGDELMRDLADTRSTEVQRLASHTAMLQRRGSRRGVHAKRRPGVSKDLPSVSEL